MIKTIPEPPEQLDPEIQIFCGFLEEKSRSFDSYMNQFIDMDEDEVKEALVQAFGRYSYTADPKKPDECTFIGVTLLEPILPDIAEQMADVFTEMLWWLFENKEDFFIERLLEGKQQNVDIH